MIHESERAGFEAQVRAHCEAGDKQAGATLLLHGYGRELLGFLIARLRDHDAASEVFSRFSEDLWRGLTGFRWQCSLRAWSYTLARHAASHYIQELQRRRAHFAQLSSAGPLSEIAAKVRSATLVSARSEARSQLVRLRESLPLDDQTLLILRINRGLAWTEIAQVMLHEGEVLDRGLLEKEAVRLRQRYQAAKKKLQLLAREAGLVRPAEDR